MEETVTKIHRWTPKPTLWPPGLLQWATVVWMRGWRHPNRRDYEGLFHPQNRHTLMLPREMKRCTIPTRNATDRHCIPYFITGSTFKAITKWLDYTFSRFYGGICWTSFWAAHRSKGSLLCSAITSSGRSTINRLRRLTRLKKCISCYQECPLVYDLLKCGRSMARPASFAWRVMKMSYCG